MQRFNRHSQFPTIDIIIRNGDFLRSGCLFLYRYNNIIDIAEKTNIVISKATKKLQVLVSLF